MLYAEYIDKTRKLNLNIYNSKPVDDGYMSVYRNLIKINDCNGMHNIELNGISISCITCTNLKADSNNVITCTFDATADNLNIQENITLEKIKNTLNSSEALLCKFCHHRIASISDITIDKVSSSIAFEDGSVCMDGDYFCHQDETCDKSTLISLDPSIPNSNINSNCLFNGMVLILSSSRIKPQSLRIESRKYLHCSCCYMTLGRFCSGTYERYIFWTNCLSVFEKEYDIDGDFLRNIDKPLLTDEVDFYSLLISYLIENEHYRVILSAITQDGCIDFMLLWLLDQQVRLYSTNLSIDHPDKGFANASDEADSNGEIGANVIKVEPVPCHRISYQLLIPNFGPSLMDAPKLLQSWRKDFGVSLIHLPWETCIGLVACLNQFSTRMAPHTRSQDQPMLRFMCGVVPLIRTVNDSNLHS